MPLDVDLGVDFQVVDDPPPSSAPVSTDTGFLIHAFVGTAPTTAVEVLSAAQARALWPTETALLTAIDAYFGAGGGRLYVSHTGLDAVAAANRFGSGLGPGQLMAPEVVTAIGIAALRDWAWANNRVYVAQAPSGATEAALGTLATGVINASASRFVMLERDFLTIPGTTTGTTRTVAASVVKAALMARSDRTTGNPNLAAAGNHTPGASGQVDYALGIVAEAPADEQARLAKAQVNCFRTVNKRVRSYGYFTLADLALLPHWWDMSGSRTVMAVRANEQAVAEEMMFGQIAADGAFLDRYKGALSDVLSRFQRVGALHGTDQSPGYTVDTSTSVNPTSALARGEVTAVILLKTSPFAAELPLRLTRRAISDTVLV